MLAAVAGGGLGGNEIDEFCYSPLARFSACLTETLLLGKVRSIESDVDVVLGAS